MPTVSICIPNLNNRPFLDERIQTILDQTFDDWELLIADNYSDDGAYEYFIGLAERDSRIKVQQFEKKGMYTNWNNALAMASGEYVYIATSDDTMSPNFLEEMVSALERHPECDLAHAPLRVIGNRADQTNLWWEKESIFSVSCAGKTGVQHVRMAPLDGLLHLSCETVYISITQLLMRRYVFEKTGFFKTGWGSAGDFHWVMKAGLLCNTIHVPQVWGGWRIHENQATGSYILWSAEHLDRIDGMQAAALDESGLFPRNSYQRNQIDSLRAQMKLAIRARELSRSTPFIIGEFIDLVVKYPWRIPFALITYFRNNGSIPKMACSGIDRIFPGRISFWIKES